LSQGELPELHSEEPSNSSHIASEELSSVIPDTILLSRPNMLPPSVSTSGQVTSILQQVPTALLSSIPSSSLQGNATTVRAANGWNSSHHYNTRFKKTFHANLTPSCTEASFDVSTISAFLAVQDNSLIPNDKDFMALSLIANNNPNVLHLGTMQKDLDRSKFEEDMRREVQDLLDNQCITVVPRSSIPAGESSLQAIWSFHHKRAPDWSITTKWKARLCPHGGQQIEGLNFWDTYAPVA